MALPTFAPCAAPDGCVCEVVGSSGCNMRRRYPASAIHDSSAFVDTSTFGDPSTESVLGEAARLTGGDRQKEYAHPSINFGRIAQMWSLILGVPVTPEQHALCMVAVKIARLMETPGHRDSLVDLAGYARTIEMLDESGR